MRQGPEIAALIFLKKVKSMVWKMIDDGILIISEQLYELMRWEEVEK
jgi:hypothetical protein